MINVRGDGLAFPAYRSYLVRFWQSNPQGCWRASAHCVQTGNTVLFGDVASLLAFLQTEIGARLETGALGRMMRNKAATIPSLERKPPSFKICYP